MKGTVQEDVTAMMRDSFAGAIETLGMLQEHLAEADCDTLEKPDETRAKIRVLLGAIAAHCDVLRVTANAYAKALRGGTDG